MAFLSGRISPFCYSLIRNINRIEHCKKNSLREPGKQKNNHFKLLLSGTVASLLQLFICHMLQTERGSRLPLVASG